MQYVSSAKVKCLTPPKLGFLDLKMVGGGGGSAPPPLSKIFDIRVNEVILGTNNVFILPKLRLFCLVLTKEFWQIIDLIS